ncbi:DUF2892 domain-containing protein [Halorubrum sp. DTA46]|uniref:YgaP family membrane protein n=1 Tax=Halorubrum sp. DTA46 TaxID=3402162 RepID=UPI003AB05F61
MNQNVGVTDKRVRTALGAVFGALSLSVLAGAVPLPSIAALVFGIAATAMLATAATGTCGLYSLIGVDTCSVSPGDSK